MERWLNRRNALIFAALAAWWRLDLASHLQLHPDEAYYWLWSRQLDVSYFDHPPMVAYFIRLTTLASDSELWVRLSGVLVSLLLSALTWRLALRLFRSVLVAAGSLILFNAYPLSTLGLVVITPDVPLLLFTALCVYQLAQLVQTGAPRHWYALGLCLGLALLSKYTAVLLVPGVLLYLLFSDERRWLRTWHPYLALLLSLACFAPVAYWNSRHDWVSFEFQLHNGLGGETASLGLLAVYLAGQMLLAGPLAWLLGVYGALRAAARRDKPALLLACTSVPVIVFFGLTSYRTLAGPNWPMFAYFGLGILASYCGLSNASRLRRALWAAAVLTSLSISLLATLQARFGLLSTAHYVDRLAAMDASNWFYGWRELGAELLKTPSRTAVITPSHQLSAEIVYYTGGRIPARPAAAARPSQFNLWNLPPRSDGEDCLNVWTGDDPAGPYTEDCLTSTADAVLTVERNGRAIRAYHLLPGRQRPPRCKASR